MVCSAEMSRTGRSSSGSAPARPRWLPCRVAGWFRRPKAVTKRDIRWLPVLFDEAEDVGVPGERGGGFGFPPLVAGRRMGTGAGGLDGALYELGGGFEAAPAVLGR